MATLQPRLFLLTLVGLLCFGASCPGQPAAGRVAAVARWSQENQVVRQGTARRKPGEADTTFLRRVFPVSFSTESMVSYAWRPSEYGRQLFFSRREIDDYQQEGEGTELFVLDPFQPNTYTIQKLLLEPIGDITNMSALFFADVDRDGQKELLALVYAEVQKVGLLEYGDGTKERAVGRMSHRRTYVFRYAGLNSAGRPRYRADAISRPYLNELPTAAAVRRALAQHQARQ